MYKRVLPSIRRILDGLATISNISNHTYNKHDMSICILFQWEAFHINCVLKSTFNVSNHFIEREKSANASMELYSKIFSYWSAILRENCCSCLVV